MVVDRTTVLPAMPYTATVAVRDDGHVHLGTWYNSMDVPEDIRSLRQNLPPLTADGVFNPTKRRSRWGGTSSDLDLINTTRSGLGLCGESTLVYAWCRSCSADSLGRAFIAADCSYGMHLDMNPTHTGWSWYRAEAERAARNGQIDGVQSARGARKMDFRVNRYIERDVKDFFYLTLRQSFAQLLGELPPGFSPWETTHAPTGPEGFLPAAAVAKGGDGTQLIALDLRRIKPGLRRGDGEPDPTGTLARADPIELALDAVIIDLGLAVETGFVDAGRIVAPMKEGDWALHLDRDTLKLGRAQEITGTIRGVRPLVEAGQPAYGEQSSGPTCGLAMVDGALLWAEGPSPQHVSSALIHMGATTAVSLPHKPGALAFVDDNQEVNPATGARAPMTASRSHTTQLYFTFHEAGPRTSRLQWKDVALTPEESKRQRRLRVQIKEARQELRNLQNEKYKLWKGKQKN